MGSRKTWATVAVALVAAAAAIGMWGAPDALERPPSSAPGAAAARPSPPTWSGEIAGPRSHADPPRASIARAEPAPEPRAIGPALPPGALPDAHAEIRGRCVAAETGLPLAGCEVFAVRRSRALESIDSPYEIVVSRETPSSRSSFVSIGSIWLDEQHTFEPAASPVDITLDRHFPISGEPLRGSPETQRSGVKPRRTPWARDGGAALLGAVKGKLAPRFALRSAPSAPLDRACGARPRATMPSRRGGLAIRHELDARDVGT